MYCVKHRALITPPPARCGVCVCCGVDIGQQVALQLFVFAVIGAVSGAECKYPRSDVAKGEDERREENGRDCWGGWGCKQEDKDEEKRK